jgi:hypothetical protein
MFCDLAAVPPFFAGMCTNVYMFFSPLMIKPHEGFFCPQAELRFIKALLRLYLLWQTSAHVCGFTHLNVHALVTEGLIHARAGTLLGTLSGHFVCMGAFFLILRERQVNAPIFF